MPDDKHETNQEHEIIMSQLSKDYVIQVGGYIQQFSKHGYKDLMQ